MTVLRSTIATDLSYLRLKMRNCVRWRSTAWRYCKWKPQCLCADHHRYVSKNPYVYTAHGMREWHNYFSDLEQAQLAINEATLNRPELPLELEANGDPGWQDVLGLIGSVAE